MKTLKIFVTISAAETIEKVVADCIALAKTNTCTVCFKFNDIAMSVGQDTNPKMICNYYHMAIGFDADWNNTDLA